MIELICRKTCSKCRAAVALLDAKGAEYRYREYTEEPLSEAELREVLGKLGLGPRDILRTGDKAYQEVGPLDDATDDALIETMVAHPTLIQRPIGVLGDRAVVGRPPENLLELL